MAEEGPLEALAPLGKPLHRHHAGEVGGRQPGLPSAPVEQPLAARAVVVGKEHVPHMGIAMHDAEVPARGQSGEVRRRREEALEDPAPFGR